MKITKNHERDSRPGYTVYHWRIDFLSFVITVTFERKHWRTP
jgi:hypothetical protein